MATSRTSPGWSTSAPPLAVEYADVGQNEEDLYLKISELLAAGTRYVWVVRLAGQRCVEVHEAGNQRSVALPGTELTAPGVLANPVPVEALYDRDAAHAATLRNLLNRQGFRDLADVQGRGREEGREEGRVSALRAGLRDVLAARDLAVTEAQLAKIEEQQDPHELARWLVAAATAKTSAAVFASKKRR